MDVVVVGEEWAGLVFGGLTPLTVEVLVAPDRLAAEVTHLGAALTSHLVASVNLDKFLLA